MINKLKPKDIIALVTISGIFITTFIHPSNPMTALGASIIGYYFGHRQDGSDTGH